MSQKARLWSGPAEHIWKIVEEKSARTISDIQRDWPAERIIKQIEGKERIHEAHRRGKKRDLYAARLEHYRTLLDPKTMAVSFDGDTRPERVLDPAELVSSIKKAAKYFRRNRDHPIDAPVLLGILADVLFGDHKKKKKGRPQASGKRWGGLHLALLDVHRNAVEKDNPGLSARKLAAEIKARYPQYKRDSVDVIRQRLRVGGAEERWDNMRLLGELLKLTGADKRR
jgi:hypothetical protein